MTTDPSALLSRPMLQSDLLEVANEMRAHQLRRLVRDYRDSALPVMNGGFAYSNIAEGEEQMFTCNPYRLWEYTSLFIALKGASEYRRFLDVGGAGSPLPYFLAEAGFDGTAIDLQPLLVAVCNHVATTRRLPLQAVIGDATKPLPEFNGRFDFVTCISVLEHIPASKRARVFNTIFEALRAGGLFYMTFDYGTYVERNAYTPENEHREESQSIGDVDEVANALEACGFRFVGNDPRTLDSSLRGLMSSPAARSVTWRYSMNRSAMDAATPWPIVLKYVLKRLLRINRVRDSRFFHHNFFRIFVEKPR